MVKQLYSAEETARRRRNFKRRLKSSPNFHIRRERRLIQVKSEEVLCS
jgi:hypothetical protein